ncbi:adenylate/guanylate cyclase domain-containing protein [Devosia naphthalenivorans]|uniref:adenylate/guanylate cyclase domain-containing protein n=1 Tax=Devosia naphthalenivorans TaxID=2082392 RepID=UPI000D37BFA5|nr:adenylate/guanylate cyclase domain-containing protein [Devosia naphthalenivorans]
MAFNYDFGYSQKQNARIFDNAVRIEKREGVPPEADFIPEADTLRIGAGKRVKATVMFIDICGSSQRASESELEQDDNLRVLSLYFSEMIRVIEELGGTIEKNTGDGLMAYFVTEGDMSGPVRGLCASLSIFKAKILLDDISARVWRLVPLDFRICLDDGWITVARVGAARRFNAVVAIGTTANLAAKMLSFADENELLLGENVQRELPAQAKQFTWLKTSDTGWTYEATGAPYRFFRYSARYETPKFEPKS